MTFLTRGGSRNAFDVHRNAGFLPENIQRICGQVWNEETLSKGMDAFATDFEPITDMRASADYRLRGGQNLLRRLYLETRGELTDSVYTYGRYG